MNHTKGAMIHTCRIHVVRHLRDFPYTFKAPFCSSIGLHILDSSARSPSISLDKEQEESGVKAPLHILDSEYTIALDRLSKTIHVTITPGNLCYTNLIYLYIYGYVV